MRRIVYAGTVFYTGDELAEALMDYARALGQQGVADTVSIPGRTLQGEIDDVELLIGPASQIVSEPVELIGPELQDARLVDSLRARTAQLAPRRPEAEPANGEHGTAATDDRPGFDDLV
jgi:hypothetical protein